MNFNFEKELESRLQEKIQGVLMMGDYKKGDMVEVISTMHTNLKVALMTICNENGVKTEKFKELTTDDLYILGESVVNIINKSVMSEIQRLGPDIWEEYARKNNLYVYNKQ